MLDPTLIRRDMRPDEVLRAMLPPVREAFREPWCVSPAWSSSRTAFTFDDRVGGNLDCLAGCDHGDCGDPAQAWAIVFATHVLPALMEVILNYGQEKDELDAALTAFRDAWCDAAETKAREETGA